MTLGERIKELRENKGWGQKELAAKVGVKQPTVAGWESGAHEVTPKNRRKLCEVLGITPNELYGITPPTIIKPDQRLIPVFDASCGKFIDWTDGSYPVGHYPENEPTSRAEKSLRIDFRGRVSGVIIFHNTRHNLK
jgi:transcriptional regulator with XRE-family HTH domain